MRIVSLIASATEIVCALGFEEALVGRSHECDYPESVKRLPVCTRPKFPVDGGSDEIDARVKAILRDGLSVYDVDAALLRELRPDVIVTQVQCAVCAVSRDDVERALAGLGGAGDTGPRIVSLEPNALADVWRDIMAVAEALGEPGRGADLVVALRTRVGEIAARAAALPRPTVACIEWLDPLMAAGNWMPELVALAGGENLFGRPGEHSPQLPWEDFVASDPDVIVAHPCGFDIERTLAEISALETRPEWAGLAAVTGGRAFVADGNALFNRPGPRIVESLEVLAEILHPNAFRFGHEGPYWRRL